MSWDQFLIQKVTLPSTHSVQMAALVVQTPSHIQHQSTSHYGIKFRLNNEYSNTYKPLSALELLNWLYELHLVFWGRMYNTVIATYFQTSRLM